MNQSPEHNHSLATDNAPVVMVPRINIGIFCDNPQTGQVLQTAVADRRMTKAHCTIQLGGIVQAAQTYQQEVTPNVIVVESHGDRQQIMLELQQLAEVCQPTDQPPMGGPS